MHVHPPSPPFPNFDGCVFSPMWNAALAGMHPSLSYHPPLPSLILSTYTLLFHVRKENSHIVDILGQLYSKEGDMEE